MDKDSIARICQKCGVEYPFNEHYFNRRSRNKSGFDSQCKVCIRKQKKLSHQRNKEHNNARSRRWTAANKEHVKVQRAARREQYPEVIEKDKTRSRRHYYANKEDKLEYKREYYYNNRAKILEQSKDYRVRFPSENIMRGKVSAHRRRARMKQVQGSYTRRDLDNLYDEQGGRCLYCGIRLFRDIPYDIHVDHIQPISRGGLNNPDNLALTCQSCNLSKADKTPDEWYTVRGW